MQTKPAPTAREIIKMEYGNSKNFMTPTVLKTKRLYPAVAIELSQGRGFENDTLYGVSVVMFFMGSGKTKRLYNLSKVFRTIDRAEDYIDGLEQGLKSLTPTNVKNCLMQKNYHFAPAGAIASQFLWEGVAGTESKTMRDVEDCIGEIVLGAGV